MKGLLVVVSGFSGVGKGTLMKELLKRYPEEYALSISATSRKPREGETDGVEYFFKTHEEFKEMIDADAFLEHAVYNGNDYGTPKEFVYQKLDEGVNVILEIEIQGGFQIKNQFKDAFLLYVIPPSAKELVRRLEERGTESHSEILNRLDRAVVEAGMIENYDYVVMNDDFETCFQEIHSMIRNIRKSRNLGKQYAASLRDELVAITKED